MTWVRELRQGESVSVLDVKSGQITEAVVTRSGPMRGPSVKVEGFRNPLRFGQDGAWGNSFASLKLVMDVTP